MYSEVFFLVGSVVLLVVNEFMIDSVEVILNDLINRNEFIENYEIVFKVFNFFLEV